VIEGEIFDVAVDIRPSSPTYRRWVGERLSASDFRQLWVPPGFAHGFCVLSETAQVLYKCTTHYYDRDDEIAISWCDPDLGIVWPIADPLVSEKDRNAPRLRDLEAMLAGGPSPVGAGRAHGR
jgi:dTDP-4-dehydrorhamnose 3,5-epimerase